LKRSFATFTALAVIKYYELRNKSVLVLAPKKLAENWTNYNEDAAVVGLQLVDDPGRRVLLEVVERVPDRGVLILGKTFTALAVIKYYELRNKSVLVLAPKKLAENWTPL
jgi:SNF2 family DNA or RNA helicase